MKSVKDVLLEAKNIAIVGISNNPEKASYMVGEYLKKAGYTIIPVNPNYDVVLGEKCYPDLKSIMIPIDIVDVFRKSEDVLPVAIEAIKLNIKCFWMQLGIRNDEAKRLLEENGILVVDDTCIKIFHAKNKK